MSVEVDPTLVRANEIKLLSGDPSKLFATVGQMDAPSLSQTLETMVEFGRSQ
jgi:GDP-D-mannose dehydratase